jgi:CheY-like chemotaxis protein
MVPGVLPSKVAFDPLTKGIGVAKASLRRASSYPDAREGEEVLGMTTDSEPELSVRGELVFPLTPTDRRQTIFVAEDDPDFRAAVGDVLAHYGFEPVLFSTAQTLLDSLDRGMPAIIVTDLMMPGLSGAELLGIVRDHVRWRDIPVVVMTGNNDTALPIRLAATIVYKPDTDELLRLISAALRDVAVHHSGEEPLET